MFKTVTVTLTAIVTALFSGTASTPVQEQSTKTVSARPAADKLQSRDERDRDKFIVSRGYKAKQLVVINYARWYAKNKLGYTDAQWKKVRDMWYKESRWDWNAVNPTSGAAGIAQMKTTSKISNPFRQVELGFKYIAHRYGGPDEAAAHWDENGNY